nr:hypothetical protein [Mycobacterium uberis]
MVPETLLQDERAALEVLADVGLVSRLRLMPIRGNCGFQDSLVIQARQNPGPLVSVRRSQAGD